MFLALAMAAELFGGALVYSLGVRRSSRVARVVGASLAVAAPVATVLLVVAIYGTGD